MKNLLTFLICFTLISLSYSCKNNTESSESVDEEIEMDNTLVESEEDIAELVEANIQEEVVQQDSTTEDKVVTKLKDISEEEKLKRQQLKKDALKENLKSSPNKGKSCEEILNDYSKMVDAFIANPSDKKVVQQLNDVRNDMIFRECKENEEFLAKVNTLDDKMEGDDEDY